MTGFATTMAQKVYDALPDSIKARLTFEQWLWLPNDEKARLDKDSTEPEWSE